MVLFLFLKLFEGWKEHTQTWKKIVRYLTLVWHFIRRDDLDLESETLIIQHHCTYLPFVMYWNMYTLRLLVFVKMYTSDELHVLMLLNSYMTITYKTHPKAQKPALLVASLQP